MNTGIIIQARRSSTRLKDKVVMPIPAGSNISMLGRVIMRSKMACDNVILATSDLAEDDLTAEEAIKYGAKVYRGSLDDVLMRYIKSAEKYNIQRIVRITADCPCLDAEVIKKAIDLHETSGVDYVSNVEKRTYPHGLDTEVVTLDALKKTDKFFIDYPLQTTAIQRLPVFFAVFPPKKQINNIRSHFRGFPGKISFVIFGLDFYRKRQRPRERNSTNGAFAPSSRT